MGFIQTVNLFILLAVPPAILIRGFDLPWRLILAFTAVGIAVELIRLTAEDLMEFRHFPQLGAAVRCFDHSIHVITLWSLLRSFKVRRLVGLSPPTDRSVAVGFYFAHVLLNFAGDWFSHANSIGFEMWLLLGGVDSITWLLTLLASIGVLSIEMRKKHVGLWTVGVLVAAHNAPHAVNAIGGSSDFGVRAAAIISWLMLVVWNAIPPEDE